MIKKIKHLSKSVKVIIFLLVLISSAYAASWVLGYGQNNNSDGLVLDLTLSEENYNAATKTFSDQSGNNNNGVSFNNATFSVDKDGKSAGAMSFNGSSDYVAMSHSSSLNMSDAITVSYWMYPKSLPSGYASHISFKSTPYTVNDATFVDYFYGLNRLEEGQLGFSAKRGGVWGTVSPRSQVLSLNTWHFITWTYHKDVGGRLYIDGVEVPGGPVGSGALAVNSQAVRLGHVFYGGHSYFHGDIDNFKIFNYVLSAAEIQSLYNDYKPKLQASSLEKGLVGYWPLDGENYNSNTNRVTDKSAYSNHGTNYGATLTEDRFGRSEGAMQFGSSKFIRIIGDKIQSGSWAYPEASFVMWVKPNSATGTGDQNIITIENSFEIALNNKQNGFSSVKYASNPWAWKSNYSNNIKNDEWSQIVYTHTYDSRRVYVNGNLLFSFNDIGNLSAGGGPYPYFTIGGRYSGTGSPFMGYIGEIRVYNRALDEGEIDSLYEKDAPKISSSSLKKGLVLDMPLTSEYLKNSNTVSDVSPFSFNGQKYLGNINKDGYDISGVDGYIDHPVISFDQNESWSFSIWQYKASGSATLWQGFLGYAMGSFGGYWMWHPSLSWYQDYYDDGSGSKAYGYMYSPVNLGDEVPYDRWYMLTVSYNGDNSNLDVYIDGELEFSGLATWSPRPVSQFSFKTIGQGGGNRYFDGKLSHLKIYNRVLSATEVKSLYDQGRGETAIILGGN